jgi:hypothetical protein
MVKYQKIKSTVFSTSIKSTFHLHRGKAMSTNWLRYLCLQAILFTILIESWIHAQADRGGVFAMPITVPYECNMEKETKTIAIHSFGALHFDDQSSYDELSSSE